MFPTDGRPGDQRGFLHKSFIGKFVGGVAKKVISSTPIGAAITTGVGIGSSIFGRSRSRNQVAQKQRGLDLKFANGGPPAFAAPISTVARFNPPRRIAPPSFGGSGPCDFPMVRDSAGNCRTPTSGELGGEQFGVGAAVMGRYGAALEPGSQIVDRAICLRGMQLGDDGLCYNKNQITNKQRMWPAGRKPLLSGGDMRAISIAARAGRRLEGASKRLQRLGMMKKPATRRALPHAHAKAATGVVSV